MDPIDLDAIIDAKPEWTDTETISRLRAVIHGQGLSMQAMSKDLRERDAEIARLSAPPGADVNELGQKLLDSFEEYYTSSFGGTYWDYRRSRVARALHQYGDERAAAATEQASRVYELHNSLVGHVEMDPERRAEWVLKQFLDGLRVGENNRGQTKDYLAGHFKQAMADAAAAARASAIEHCAEWHDLLAEQISTGAPQEGREERLWIEADWHREMAKAFRSGALATKAREHEMTCPNCGNRDGAKVRTIVKPYDDHAKTVRFWGYECLMCGAKYEASPASVLRDFDPPSDVAAKPGSKP